MDQYENRCNMHGAGYCGVILHSVAEINYSALVLQTEELA